jgi:hypothetical protein
MIEIDDFEEEMLEQQKQFYLSQEAAKPVLIS